MKLNKDCVRMVLMYIEDHCVYITNEYNEKTMH
jgi:hypothetical protein